VRQQRAFYLGVAAAIVVALATFVGVFAMTHPRHRAAPVRADQAPAARQIAHIRATLFYASNEGEHLVSVVREVPLAGGVDQQAREILAIAFEAPNLPLRAAVPAGTTVRGFYLTAGGDAFVDLSSEVVTAHPGGTAAEILTVYAVVNAITANLPTVKRVQILVNGKQVDTLAGHIDLRGPLQPDKSMVREN
jgi:spore germination protein GerM